MFKASLFNLSVRKPTACISLVLLGLITLTSCENSPSEMADNTGGAELCAPELAEVEFGIISTESQDNLKTTWEPFLADMTESLGRPVKGFYATDYAGVIEAMGANKIQLAWYGGKSYIEAAKRSNAEAFAQTVSLDGSKGYYSHLITNKENAIVKNIDLEKGNGDQYVIKNAKDLTFAFNDPNSTSGFLVPTYYVFAKNGANAEKIFSELVFSGSHEATALAVANNQVDVATNNNENLDRLKETDPEALDKIQVIWTSPVIPSDPLAYRKDLPNCMKTAIQDFMFNYDNQEVLTALQWKGLDPASDADWNTIRELQIAKDILEIQNNEKLAAADKDKRVTELEDQLKSLQ